MAKGDLFKRSLEAGTSFLDMTRERAEAMVKEWVEAGDLGRSRAQKAVEQVLDRSRKATDELRALVRKEIADQLAALGVATREDVARLEAKMDAARPTAPGVGDTPPSPPPSTGVSTGAAAAAATAAGETLATARKTTGAKTTPTKKATAGRTATATGATEPAKVSKASKASKASKVSKVSKKAVAPRKPPPVPRAGPPPGT